MTTEPSRRKFIGQAGATATALCLPGYLLAQEERPGELKFPDVSELVKHLPPRARYVAPQIPDDQNGYLAYRKMLEAVVSTDQLDARLKSRLGENVPNSFDYSLHNSDDREFPRGAEGEIVEIWLEENQRAHELARAASQFARGLVPADEMERDFRSMYGGEGDSFDIGPTRSWLLAEELRVLRDLDAGDTAEAMSTILVLSKLHRMLRTTSGVLVTMMFVLFGGRVTLRLMRVLARHRGAIEEQVTTLREELSRYDVSRQWIANCYRAEFHYFTLPLVKHLQDAKSLPELANVLIRFRGEFPVPQDKDPEKVIRDLIPELLEGHPQPFDAIATTKEAGKKLEAEIDRIVTSNKPAVAMPDDLKKPQLLWPNELVEALGYWTFSFDRSTENSEEPPLNAERKRALREQLRKVTNPLGRLLFIDHNAGDFSPGFRSYDSDVRLTQLVLAGRLFWNRHKRVPRSLEELVDEKLLDSVPVDPFGEGPLKYDPDRALVWSVAHNGIDDRGKNPDDYDPNDYDPNDTRDDLATPMPRF